MDLGREPPGVPAHPSGSAGAQDVTQCDPSTTILGQKLAMPVILAPVACHRLFHPEGEFAVARAAAQAGLVFTVSTGASYSLEEVARSCEGPRWFQLYAYQDRKITRGLVERAEAAGYQAICLTVDSPVSGRRERDLRNLEGAGSGSQGAYATSIEPRSRSSTIQASPGTLPRRHGHRVRCRLRNPVLGSFAQKPGWLLITGETAHAPAGKRGECPDGCRSPPGWISRHRHRQRVQRHEDGTVILHLLGRPQRLWAAEPDGASYGWRHCCGRR